MRPAAAIFALAAVAQWLLPLIGIWQHERIIARGTAVRIECIAPDPYDPLRGRYLAVEPAGAGAAVPPGTSEQADVPSDGTRGNLREAPAPPGMPEQGAVPVWATLVAGADGLSRIESLSLEPVSGPTVIRLVAARRSLPFDGPSAGETVFIQWPFDRFYLNERLAPDADKMVAEQFRAGGRPVAEIRLLDGRAVLTDVLLDGVSIREIVKRRAQ